MNPLDLIPSLRGYVEEWDQIQKEVLVKWKNGNLWKCQNVVGLGHRISSQNTHLSLSLVIKIRFVFPSWRKE